MAMCNQNQNLYIHSKMSLFQPECVHDYILKYVMIYFLKNLLNKIITQYQ